MKQLSWILGLLLMMVLTGCGDNMRNQPKFIPLRETTFFKDGRSARDLVEGTVPRGFLREDELMYQGKKDGKFSDVFPFDIDKKVLERGQQRFNIYCSVCHDRLGYGHGIVVQRGFKQPPSYHDERLRNMAPGYFYNVITNGFGAMPDFRSEIKPYDRWAIAAYIRALQFSQDVELNKLNEQQKAEIMSGRP